MEKEENKEKQIQRKNGKSKILKEIIVYGLIFIFIVVISPRYIWAKALVDGHSMEETLQNEDILIQEKVSYYFKEPGRYDVIILEHHGDGLDDEDGYWVKRIIGLPGETIQIKKDGIYINNSKLEDEHYGTGEIDVYGIAEEPYKIPEGEYFVMGDNREGEESRDSRYEDVGSIKREDIIGHVILRVYPINTFGLID